MRFSARFLGLMAVLVGLTFLLSANTVYAGQGIAFSISQTDGLQAQLVATMTSAQPVLDQPLALTITAKPLLDAPELRLHWNLPVGVILLDGAADESLGPVRAEQTMTLVRHIRIDTPGLYRVGLRAEFQPHAFAQFGASALLFFSLDEHGGSVSAEDAQASAKLQELIPLGPEALVSAANNQPDAPNDDCVTIHGKLTRIDKFWLGPSTGYRIDTIPVTHARVELWESDPLFDDNYGPIPLNETSGEFNTVSCHGDGWHDNTKEYYIKIWASVEGAPGKTIARVFPYPLPGNVYGGNFPHSFKSQQLSISGAGFLEFGTLALNEEMSGAINIVESIYAAWRMWNDSDGDANRTKYDDVSVLWSPGIGDGPYYNTVFDTIHLKGKASDPDQWDETLIIHEWTHLADDKWGCDGNPGGDHDGFSPVDPELAWSEGFPDFYQGVVRNALNQTYPEYYADLDDLGDCYICFDMEHFDTDYPDSRSDHVELAIAGALWDLVDYYDDGQDQVTLTEGYPVIERTWLYPYFTTGNVKYCSFQHYLSYWDDAGGPTDAAAAAVITQNTGLTDVFDTAVAAAQQKTTQLQSVGEIQQVAQTEGTTTDDYRWWDRVAFIVDNSASMAGARLNAVKSVLKEQVDEMAASLPHGVEFRLDAFNNVSPLLHRIFVGQFYPNEIKPLIQDKLGASVAADDNCPVDAFGALKQAVEGEHNLNAWLFTDNYPLPTLAPLENFRAELVNHGVRTSFVLLQSGGGCLDPMPSAEITARRQQLQRQLLFTAGASPSEPADSIVPYLLTALATGGQFLFVDDGQMASAAEILQVQLSHNAGAGQWSDYVSSQPSYRYDRLASWDYNWIAAGTVGTPLALKPGGLGGEGYVDLPLPEGFLFYGRPVTVAHVYENGYLTFDGEFGEENDNTPLPSAAAPNGALYPYWDDLEWEVNTLADAPDAADDEGTIYTAQMGDWYVIQYQKYASFTSNGRSEIFEVLLNLKNGEIVYQYDAISNGVPSATIGLESWSDFNPINGVQVSYNDAGAAASGIGYRFVPVPAQPTKNYSVTVDASMQSIGFLLTGYDGTLAPMTIRTPNGATLACNSSDVLCINIGMVQYVQANVGNRSGLWTIEVRPGTSGAGTFSFSSMAAGLLEVTGPSRHTLPTAQASVLTIDLGQPVDGNQLTGHFRTPADHPFGASFVLHDDGTHGDGAAGDGHFGSDPFTPEQSGSAYLWVEGELNGQPFLRAESKPYSFQPLRLVGPDSASSLDAKTVVSFTLYNDDAYSHTFAINVQVPPSWRGQLDLLGDSTVQVNAGLSLTFPVAIWMGPTDQESLDQPSGATGTVNVAAIETEQGMLYDSTALQVTRHRPPARIDIFNPFLDLPTGQSGQLQFTVRDKENYPVADGTVLALSTTLGTLPVNVTTQFGYAEADFAADTQSGPATISAQISNGVRATTTISITPPIAMRVLLTPTLTTLPADGASTTQLVATVLDTIGQPIAGEIVRIGVEGDDNQYGTVNGSEVVSGTTGAAGKLIVTFTSGIVDGPAAIRAELLQGEVIISDAQTAIILDGRVFNFMPFVGR